MSGEINVLLVEPGKAPCSVRVRNTERAFERLLGGRVDTGVILPQKVLLVFRENGWQQGLVPNRLTPGRQECIAGPFLLCGLDEDGFASLTLAEKVEFQRYFARPGEFMRVGKDILCVSPGDFTHTACTLWESMKDGESVTITKYGGAEGGRSAWPNRK